MNTGFGSSGANFYKSGGTTRPTGMNV